MENRTTIQLENLTLEKLKKLKTSKRETYDQLLNRLINRDDSFSAILIEKIRVLVNG